MDDQKRDFSDFFKRTEHDAERQESERRNAEDAQAEQDRPSYYYAYGPYKGADQRQPGDDTTAVSATGESNPVEVTPPRPIRPLGLAASEKPQQPMSWSVNEPRRRSSLRSTFAAFMAGAVVVASLMFASDKMNLFTGEHQLSASGGSGSSSAAAVSGTPSDNGGVKSAAFTGDRPNSFAQIVDKSSPAVVLVKSYVKQQRLRGGSSMFNDPFFRYFFGDGQQQQPRGRQPQQQPNNGDSSGSLQQQGLGSGFIFEQSGYILTNEHVIDGADEVRVVMEGSDKEYTAKVVGSSYDYDLAVLKIEGDKPFPMLPLGNPDETAIGDWVVAIGNPLGFDHTVTVGVLSAKERPIEIPDNNGTRQYKHLLQTDASINPGNSGGPLLNMAGEVIGINTAVSSQAQGIGFAIPTSTIKELLPNLKSGTKIPKPAAPYIGVTLQDIDQQMQQMLKLDSTDGTMVYNVLPGGPAFKAGVKQYDVIVGANGEKVTGLDDLKTKITSTKVGDKITLSVIRDGKKMDIDVTVGDMNADSEQDNG